MAVRAALGTKNVVDIPASTTHPVGMEGFEPSRLAARDPKSRASASSATCPGRFPLYQLPWRRFRFGAQAERPFPRFGPVPFLSHPPPRPTAFPLYRFYRLTAFKAASSRRTPKIHPSANPPIRKSAHSPDFKAAPRRRTPKIRLIALPLCRPSAIIELTPRPDAPHLSYRRGEHERKKR